MDYDGIGRGGSPSPSPPQKKDLRRAYGVIMRPHRGVQRNRNTMVPSVH